MIDRKGFWFCIACILVMCAAAFWRISLLPDWHALPRFNDSGAPISSITSLILFVSPGGIALVLLIQRAGRWLIKSPDEAIKPWKKWNRLLMVAMSVVMTLSQSFIIARSLGIFPPVTSVQMARGTFVVMGVLLIIVFNSLPKLPWLNTRFLDLDSANGARFMRARAYFGIVLGLLMIVTGLFVPIGALRSVIWGAFAVVMVCTWIFRICLRRSQQTGTL